jgi:hypothetical protein
VRESLAAGEDSVERADPYFLGSIVLVRGDRQEHEIVDGQQRLITLTILLAALRELLPDHLRERITTRLYEPPDPLTGAPGRYRLRPKQADADFFRVFIQAQGGINRLFGQPHADLTDGQQNILANARYYCDQLRKLDEEQRMRLARYLLERCVMVVISAPGLVSAYRIFTVLNNRGVDLTDILKADIIGPIPANEQYTYTERWERLEESLGTANMTELLSHLRVIFARARPTDRLDDFRKHVLSRYPDTRRLIDDVMVPYGAAFSLILTPEQDAPEPALNDEAREILYWLRQVANHDWVPPALVYLTRHHNQPARIVRFLTELERLAAYFAVCQQYAHRRQPRYRQVMEAVEQSQDLRESNPQSPIQLSQYEREAFLGALEGDLYAMPPTPRNYVLRRLDSWLAGSAARYDQRKLTVEHVLPRHPAPSSEWMRAFLTAQERAKWMHKMGNLALLTRDKNANASNYDFATMKRIYFASHGGVTPYALTTQVLREEVWTPEVVARRQRELVALLREKWRL